MSVFDRLAKESEAERQEWARRNAQTAAESSGRANQDLGRGSSLFDRLEKVCFCILSHVGLVFFFFPAPVETQRFRRNPKQVLMLM